MKIYKYYNWNIPRCVNLWRGYYKNGTEEIGFGSNDTKPDNNAVEITEADYYKHVSSIGGSITEATELLEKFTALESKDFYGYKPKTSSEVMKISNDKIEKLFSDPLELLTTTEYQIKLMSQMIVILLAYQGVINYGDTGIQGVVDKSSADSYVLSLLPIWQQANQIASEAKQFIEDNL